MFLLFVYSTFLASQMSGFPGPQISGLTVISSYSLQVGSLQVGSYSGSLFYLTNQDLAHLLGRTDFHSEDFNFGDFGDSNFLES